MASPNTTRAQSGDETAIRKVIDDFGVAYKKHDQTAFGNCLVKSDDLYFIDAPGLPTVDLFIVHGY